jgi:hypothetical protein
MKSTSKKIAFVLLVSAVVALGGTFAQQPSAEKSVVPSDRPGRLAAMKTKGPDASLSILPVRLAGKPFDRVTEVVGVLLEQQGLKNIELASTPFEPAPANLHALATSVGEFVKAHPVTTDYVLYAELNGTREHGLIGFRTVVTDKRGAVVWIDRQGLRDKAVKSLKEREPMTLCALLVERLGPQFGLNEQTAKAATPGKLAALMAARSGIPPENETAPVPGRQKEFKEARQTATIAVFPVRIGNEVNATSAAALAKSINDAGLCKAVVVRDAVVLKASHADPNEMKVMWDLAREFREYARKNPTDADYALYADYAFTPNNWEQGFVHFIVCNRQGDWVIVDMQNSHHPDYQSVKPTSSQGCDTLLFKRLQSYLQ